MPSHPTRFLLLVLVSGILACDEKPIFEQAPTDHNTIVVGLRISSVGVASSAQRDNSDMSEYNDAQIVMFVQNSLTGRGETSIAPLGHTGNSQSEISLPDGWNLNTATVPGGGCSLKPTHLYNDNLGGYTLSVMTKSIYGPCLWLKGEYTYRLSIDDGIFVGGTVGRIVIE